VPRARPEVRPARLPRAAAEAVERGAAAQVLPPEEVEEEVQAVGPPAEEEAAGVGAPAARTQSTRWT
jgi:hypothetical protein